MLPWFILLAVHTGAVDTAAAAPKPAPPPRGGMTTTSRFGVRKDPLTAKHTFHSGVDLAAPMGAPINSIANGQVVFSGSYGGFGNLITIRHGNGVTSHYAHCGVIKVRVGDIVQRGDVIGLVGQTGRATGPHVHLEIRYKGKPVDPEKVV